MLVPRETNALLRRFVDAVIAENTHQNLVAASTVPVFWERHVDDALQLVPLIAKGPLIDVGSGAGLPGIVLAAVIGMDVVLVEPRRRRADFLRRLCAELPLPFATVRASRIEHLEMHAPATITARAVMSLDSLFAATNHLRSETTRYVLPKGRTAASELALTERSWHGRFELIDSRTDPGSAIVVAEAVRRRERQ